MLVSHMNGGDFLVFVSAWKHLQSNPFTNDFELTHYWVDTGKLPQGSAFSTVYSFHLLNQCCLPESRLNTHLVAPSLHFPYDHISLQWMNMSVTRVYLSILSFSWNLCQNLVPWSFLVCAHNDWLIQRSGTWLLIRKQPSSERVGDNDLPLNKHIEK